jgi:hypothetical protein
MIRKTPKDYGGKLCYAVKNVRKRNKKVEKVKGSKGADEGMALMEKLTDEEQQNMISALTMEFKYLPRDHVLHLWTLTSGIRTKNYYMNNRVTPFAILNEFRYLKEPYAPQLVYIYLTIEIFFSILKFTLTD